MLSGVLLGIKADQLRRSESDIEKIKEDLLEEVQKIINKIHHEENRSSISNYLSYFCQVQMAHIKNKRKMD